MICPFILSKKMDNVPYRGVPYKANCVYGLQRASKVKPKLRFKISDPRYQLNHVYVFYYTIWSILATSGGTKAMKQSRQSALKSVTPILHLSIPSLYGMDPFGNLLLSTCIYGMDHFGNLQVQYSSKPASDTKSDLKFEICDPNSQLCILFIWYSNFCQPRRPIQPQRSNLTSDSKSVISVTYVNT